MATTTSPNTKQQQSIPHVKSSDLVGELKESGGKYTLSKVSPIRLNHILDLLWGKAASSSTGAGATGAVGPAGPAGPAGGIGTYTQVTPGGGAAATPDLSGGNWSTIEVLLNAATITINDPTSGSTAMFWVLVLKQDTTGGRGFSFGSAYAGTADQVGALDQTALTYSVLVFVVRPDGKSMLLGVPISGEPY